MLSSKALNLVDGANTTLLENSFLPTLMGSKSLVSFNALEVLGATIFGDVGSEWAETHAYILRIIHSPHCGAAARFVIMQQDVFYFKVCLNMGSNRRVKLGILSPAYSATFLNLSIARIIRWKPQYRCFSSAASCVVSARAAVFSLIIGFMSETVTLETCGMLFD